MFLRRLISTVLRSEPAASYASPPHNFNPEAIQESLNSTTHQIITCNNRVELPYFVARTSLGKNLPVYVDYKHGGSKVITIIRRIHGDPEKLAADLKAELPPKAEFRVRPEMQQVIVKGQHVQKIREFLTYKGF